MLNRDTLRKSNRQLSTEIIKVKKNAPIHTFTIKNRVLKIKEACTFTKFYN